MSRAARSALAAVGVAICATPAAAEGWSITQLGAMSDAALCIEKARRVVEAYRGAHGGGEVTDDDWAVYAFDLAPALQDAVIFCPTAAGGSVEPFLIVQSESEPGARARAADALLGLWNGD